MNGDVFNLNGQAVARDLARIIAERDALAARLASVKAKLDALGSLSTLATSGADVQAAYDTAIRAALGSDAHTEQKGYGLGEAVRQSQGTARDTGQKGAGRMSAPERCGEHYAEHPTKPHLIAVCTLPKGHEGEHSNALAKPGSVPR